MRLWVDASPLNQIFGIGFGYIRSTDLFSTLLVNTGVVGTVFISTLMLYPAFRLDWDPRGMALRQCCAATWTMMMVSVPEFAYLAPWTLVAMAYVRVRALKLARQHDGDRAAAAARQEAQDGASIGTAIGRHVRPDIATRIGSRFGPRGRHL
jgi:hypothetical protein